LGRKKRSRYPRWLRPTMRLTDTPRPCRSMPARDGEGRAEQGRDPHGARVRAVPRASTPGTDERFGRPAGRFADGAPSWTGPDRASITPALYRPRVLRGAGAQVAQVVEHVTENHGVGGSIPRWGSIRGCALVLCLSARVRRSGKALVKSSIPAYIDARRGSQASAGIRPFLVHCWYTGEAWYTGCRRRMRAVPPGKWLELAAQSPAD